MHYSKTLNVLLARSCSKTSRFVPLKINAQKQLQSSYPPLNYAVFILSRLKAQKKGKWCFVRIAAKKALQLYARKKRLRPWRTLRCSIKRARTTPAFATSAFSCFRRPERSAVVAFSFCTFVVHDLEGRTCQSIPRQPTVNNKRRLFERIKQTFFLLQKLETLWEISKKSGSSLQKFPGKSLSLPVCRRKGPLESSENMQVLLLSALRTKKIGDMTWKAIILPKSKYCVSHKRVSLLKMTNFLLLCS